MKATVEYMERKFQEYNDLCFEGKLKPLPFKLTKARSYLGQVMCKRKRMADGRWRYSDFVFSISTLIDMPEAEVEDVILHEMIHYYILSNQLQDTAPHGVLFVRLMNAINSRYHRHITVSHRRTKEEYDKDEQVRQHLVCVSRFRDGHRGITIAARSRLFQLWDGLPRVPDIVECQWYVSSDSFFNRYPRAASLKVYSISPADLELHLRDARPLIRKGDTILVGKRN